MLKRTPQIITQAEADEMVGLQIFLGTFFGAIFNMQPDMMHTWNKTNRVPKGLAKSWGFTRWFKSCRFDVKIHCKVPGHPETPTTADLKQYNVVWVRDNDTKNYRNLNRNTLRVLICNGKKYWVANTPIFAPEA